MRMARRTFLAALGLAGCSRCERAPSGAPTSTTPTVSIPDPPRRVELPESGPEPRGKVSMDVWSLDGGGKCAVLAPAWSKDGARFPLLLALHGRGEAMKGPERGVMGWPKDYALIRAIERVCSPPITSDDLEGFVDPKRLAAHNEDLAKRPFAGLVVACPYSPDVDLHKPREMHEYADYVMRALVPKLKKEMPVVDAPGAMGIDGVSLGGALALRIGLWNAAAFGAVGSLQAAIGEDQVDDFTELGKAARRKNQAVKLRLLTSHKDYFRDAIAMVSRAWKEVGISHDYVDVPGPHDYPFNRGPGAIEMLLWHDRLLARG